MTTQLAEFNRVIGIPEGQTYVVIPCGTLEQLVLNSVIITNLATERVIFYTSTSDLFFDVLENSTSRTNSLVLLPKGESLVCKSESGLSAEFQISYTGYKIV